MAGTFAAQAGLIWKVELTGSKSAGAAAVAVLFLYLGLFTTGFQAVVWVYPSEILPLQLRQKGSSISTAANWICNFAIVEMTPSAIKNIGYKFYIIFAVLNALWVPIIWLFFPETKGRSLEDIDLLFSSQPLGDGDGDGDGDGHEPKNEYLHAQPSTPESETELKRPVDNETIGID